ncbi:L-2-hydroxyglutarate oxidase [Pseudoteredinibacter isoporae]|uniref:L-2-hydroxyglutarate oxidase n=1 Tax=Pseudoteredinibacter isoporae TaxID=570281 RepID=A0A7X0JQC6_9GAMM|nr:L-2-hydroxyglutarate oxidase [Pseudoteredinibacter isoporae]MBB6520359.1 L-2-hydroxyglutarate oxidase [Pseudoteredinibacter isoporae]NHO85929.1 L-2-hydroxyglutarate oxidase [Pseudoteredinibacter isoporae]NIB25619.1 L-2-hydroxyglutarate oxidase [Pseudoteredinibacter isoporae]
MPDYDAIIIGAGIIGAATASRLQELKPSWRIALIEKESDCAQHQTGRNSGVIHAGVYYAPGSLKAKLCVEGNRRTKAFCREHNIAFDECGKLLVACHQKELEGLAQLKVRAEQNGLDVDVLDGQQLAQREPNIRGLGALFVPASGIVDYAEICRSLLSQFRERGGQIFYGCEVHKLIEKEGEVCVFYNDANDSEGHISCQQLIACSGIQADKLVQSLGLDLSFRMMPFRGEYFQLSARHNQIIRHLIYPVPDPSMPFLGVHLTRMIDGSVTVGPNAVLAFGREAYRKTQLSLPDLLAMASYSGSYRLLGRFWKAGLGELRDSMFKGAYLKRVQNYCPSLTKADLQPYRAGIRAQAVDHEGNMIDDFLFARSQHSLVVCNAPSPAATSALPIADHILKALNLHPD